MSQQLINLSPDLKRLRDEGYEIEVHGGYLLIHHIPYVSQNREVKFGSFVSNLTLINGTKTGRPDNHVMHFIGENPCNIDGTVISAIQYSNVTTRLNNQITINRSFSNKPKAGYANYYEKVKRYDDLICAPAQHLDPSVTSKTFKAIPDANNE